MTVHRSVSMAAAAGLVATGLIAAGAASASAAAPHVSPADQYIKAGQSASWSVSASQTVYIDWGTKTPLYKHAAGRFTVSHTYSDCTKRSHVYTQHFYIGGTDITTRVHESYTGPICG